MELAAAGRQRAGLSAAQALLALRHSEREASGVARPTAEPRTKR